jgi:hypothetical protein
MAWEESILKRTLIVHRSGQAPNFQYRLYPFMRITTRDGETFLEPIPSGPVSLPHMGYVFTDVAFMEEGGSGAYGAGDTWLTRETNRANLQLTSE